MFPKVLLPFFPYKAHNENELQTLKTCGCVHNFLNPLPHFGYFYSSTIEWQVISYIVSNLNLTIYIHANHTNQLAAFFHLIAIHSHIQLCLYIQRDSDIYNVRIQCLYIPCLGLVRPQTHISASLFLMDGIQSQSLCDSAFFISATVAITAKFNLTMLSTSSHFILQKNLLIICK